MLLSRLSVQNFGQFRDKHTFDLSTSDAEGSTKPIILFGGKNGAGKTTLFEAFRLCLYGSTLPEFQIKGLDYQKYIRSKIHRSTKLVLQPVTASITIDFDYARQGVTQKYTVERRWHRNDDHVDEEFHVSINGKVLEEIESSQWQEFVKDLIPVGVSKLFFFDGEQIQALAQDNTDEIHLRQSFYSLLGLDLVDRLKSDLHIRLIKNARDADKEFGKKLDGLERQLKRLESEKEKILQESSSLENTLEVKKRNATAYEERLAKEGGSFAQRREQLMQEKAVLETEIDRIYDNIRSLCEGLLPFTFIPHYCKALKERLEKEDEAQSKSLTSSQIAKSINSVRRHAIASVKRMVTESNGRAELVKELEKIFEHEINKKASRIEGTAANTDLKIIRHLSNYDKTKILHWIDTVLEDIPGEIKHLSTRLEKLTIQLQRTGDHLSKAPSNEVIAPIVRDLTKLNQDIGKIQARIKANDEQVKQLDYKIMHVNVAMREATKNKKKFEKVNRGLLLAHKTEMALQEYEDRLKDEKLQQLSISLIECLNELMHKEIFQKAHIDPETFAVTLYDSENNAIPKDQLSAGEKQMYAIAILWALARTSGRPLPFIVDTPLARLDSDHRLNLVNNFFPVASHQVIIFSTDTEVDERYFEELSDDIARSYKLEYSKEYGMSTMEQGYFWRPRTETEEVAITK
jgi:DNA sulfur modification protein DndD